MNDPYKEKRQKALTFLRERNNYCLDKGSREYHPYNEKRPLEAKPEQPQNVKPLIRRQP